MAIYKIFSGKDSTLYSYYPTQNTGLDEILEVGVRNSALSLNSVDDIRRALVYFDNSDLDKIKSFTTGSWATYLRLYLANAENLNTSYTVLIQQVSQSWEMGTGKYGDSPVTTNGVCWYTTSSWVSGTNTNWNNPVYYITNGGGSWTNVSSSQTFNYKDNKDINANVTNIVNTWFSGSAQNHGFLLKLPYSQEANSGSYMTLAYFSVDTHTIYPPTLEMKWDDSSYNTGSLQVINNSDFVVTLENNMNTFKWNTEKYMFRVNARDKYPVRTFTTSSVYLVNKALPQTSYWAIQDVKTEDMIFDFDTNYTKISCDSTGSFFNVYMNGLEPERYYKVLIKTTLSTGETIDIDNNLIFKVVR